MNLALTGNVPTSILNSFVQTKQALSLMKISDTNQKDQEEMGTFYD